MKEEFLSIAKNCAICVAAGITVSIAIKYFTKDSDFSLQSFIDVSALRLEMFRNLIFEFLSYLLKSDIHISINMNVRL